MKRFLLFVLISILFCSTAFASYINLHTQLTTQVEGDVLKFSLTSKNKGDEAAHNVQAELLVAGRKYLFKKENILRVGQTYRVDFPIKLSFLKKGEYPLLLKIHYADQNLYAFSSLTAQTFNYRTEKRPDVVKASLKGAKLWKEGAIRLVLRNNSDQLKEVKTSLLLPNELQIERDEIKTSVNPKGKEEIKFNVRNQSALSGSRYQVFAVSEYEVDGIHQTDIASGMITVSEPREIFGINYLWIIFILGLFVVLFIAAQLLFVRKRNVLMVDILLLLFIVIFLLFYFQPKLLFLPTTINGGDTGSHYPTAMHLKEVLLPQGKIMGWMQGNYAGFPLFYHYFPFPFIMMALLSFLIPMQVAFKLISVLGIFLLPFTVYFAFRFMKYEFPIPIFGAIFSLAFLFNQGNSMWGANIPSTLAGEFCYSIGFAFVILFLGSLYRGVAEKRYLVFNALLIFLIGFSHAYTLRLDAVS